MEKRTTVKKMDTVTNNVIGKCWIKAIEIPATKEMRYLPAIYLFAPIAAMKEVVIIEVENVFKANRMIRDQQGKHVRPTIYKTPESVIAKKG